MTNSNDRGWLSLHVGNFLDVTLLQQWQEGTSHQVGTGDISSKCRVEIRPVIMR